VSLQKLSAAQKQQFVGILELICQELEISETRYKEAKKRYETISDWLTASDDYRLMFSKIYPQGSFRHGTTVKPIGREEFDVDLVCHLKFVNGDSTPRQINKLVGDRLRENGTFENMMEPLNRGWRIKYSNEFHLDITPSIINPACKNGGELVPDRKLQDWKPSNPEGYAKWFDEHAALSPIVEDFAAARAEILPFPVQGYFKGVLRRAVQIFKHHRDLYFQDKDCKLKPISIIINTLAAKAYKYCIRNKIYQSDLDLLMDILLCMNDFIVVRTINGATFYFVPNETTVGENFAEKWNEDSQRAVAFYDWYEYAMAKLNNLWTLAGSGIDIIAEDLSESFGSNVVHRAISRYTDQVGGARSSGILRAVPGIGLTTAESGTRIHQNTFFGK